MKYKTIDKETLCRCLFFCAVLGVPRGAILILNYQ